MQGEKKERWMNLCEQAVQEQDPEKLMLLVQEITRLLDEKQERLKERGEQIAAAGQAMGKSSELMSRHNPGSRIALM
jgi:hypothetical protein